MKDQILSVKKPLIKKLFYIFILCFLLTGILTAQTKQETIEFIEKKVNQMGKVQVNSENYGNTYQQRLGSIKFHGCRVSVSNESFIDGESRSIFKWQFNLSQMDPTRVKIEKSSNPDSWTLYVYKREGEVSAGNFIFTHFDYLRKKWITNPVKDGDVFWIEFSEERKAIQIKKAFIHLIKLCGGKGELF
ncbi:MAG: hypothetical protein GTO45_33745 [Candidatus Aminicenantes bacterium]|nr:hypothetical protein [Candidatus Aminicenantes bacterium]NIM83673.1 hypothetical protein [Candidatus Aminicenantes bacterium]NIN23098.1 hypothetical protein [Candidatus Aminicenantes bacterium]NIN46825.1 hypothetical protein [Candidatus Aminicenantes bacterium]NIN89747.1 hypothetical protein [Candidatus Aminicenantes bacterium]